MIRFKSLFVALLLLMASSSVTSADWTHGPDDAAQLNADSFLDLFANQRSVNPTIDPYLEGKPILHVSDDGPTAATGSFTFSGGVPTATETVTIGHLTYTFVAVPSASCDVDIGVDAATTAQNLTAAINNGAGGGTAYIFCPHALVSASESSGVVTLTYFTTGFAGNALAISEAATNVTVSGASLVNGDDGGLMVAGSDSNSGGFNDPFDSPWKVTPICEAYCGCTVILDNDPWSEEDVCDGVDADGCGIRPDFAGAGCTPPLGNPTMMAVYEASRLPWEYAVWDAAGVDDDAGKSDDFPDNAGSPILGTNGALLECGRQGANVNHNPFRVHVEGLKILGFRARSSGAGAWDASGVSSDDEGIDGIRAQNCTMQLADVEVEAAGAGDQSLVIHFSGTVADDGDEPGSYMVGNYVKATNYEYGAAPVTPYGVLKLSGAEGDVNRGMPRAFFSNSTLTQNIEESGGNGEDPVISISVNGQVWGWGNTYDAYSSVLGSSSRTTGDSTVDVVEVVSLNSFFDQRRLDGRAPSADDATMQMVSSGSVGQPHRFFNYRVTARGANHLVTSAMAHEDDNNRVGSRCSLYHQQDGSSATNYLVSTSATPNGIGDGNRFALLDFQDSATYMPDATALWGFSSGASFATLALFLAHSSITAWGLDDCSTAPGCIFGDADSFNIEDTETPYDDGTDDFTAQHLVPAGETGLAETSGTHPNSGSGGQAGCNDDFRSGDGYWPQWPTGLELGAELVGRKLGGSVYIGPGGNVGASLPR